MVRGIVLSGQAQDGQPYPMVLIYEKQMNNIRDFKLMPIITDKVKYRKDKKQRLAERENVKVQVVENETLLFGDMVEFDYFDDRGREREVVWDYVKVQNEIEARLFDGDSQLLLTGTMSRNRKVLWMLDIWPDLEIPYRLQQCSHPNVAVDCWVTVKITNTQSLKYELHSFVGPSEQFQHLTKFAKWNKGNEGNVTTFIDPVSNDRPNPNFAPDLAPNITAMRGLVMSNKCVLSEEENHRDVCFHRIVISESDRFPPVGSYVKFNAETVDFLRIYALKSVVNIANVPQFPVTERQQLKMNIRYCEDLPGFYHCKKLNIYVDDPINVLENWLLSEYTRSTLQVAIIAGEPSDKGIARYAVSEVVDAKTKKIADLKADGKLSLTNELAVVIETDGEVYVPRLPKSTIRLSKEDAEKYPPGTVLRISAVPEKKWQVTSAELDRKTQPFHAVCTMDEATDMETVLFCVPELRGCREFPTFLYDPIFGFVQQPRSERILRNPERARYNDVWITLNDCHPGDVLLPPVRFKVFTFDHLHENIPRSMELSPIPSSSARYEADPEYRRESALNSARIPSPVSVLGDQELNTLMLSQGVDVHQMVRDLENSREWRSDRQSTIENMITQHEGECRTCYNHTPDELCYFSEFLALVLKRAPEIVNVLHSKNFVSDVYLRRFRS